MNKNKRNEDCVSCCSHHEHHHHHGHGHHDHHHEHAHHHDHHHEHDHHHHEHGGITAQLLLIAATVVLLAAAVAIEHSFRLPTWQLLLVYLVPYLLIGHDTLKEAAEGVLGGNAFNEHFLMSVATVGALLIGFLPGADTQFPEAVAVMLFFQVGELFEGYAEGRSRRSIAHLMDIRPDTATVVRQGAAVVVAPGDVLVGETIVVKPGEKVPLDGTVIEGQSSLNTVALTGESQPRDVSVGDEVLSGCVNLSGVLRIAVSKPYGQSTVARIIELVESAGEQKSRSETFIARFARVYTPVVVLTALALAVLPPLVLTLVSSQASFAQLFATWLYRALTFLVVSCPCALVISVPLSFVGGIGGASRRGILIKGSAFMDTLARTGTVVFDKTGTLTHGEFRVSAVHQQDSRLLHLAAHVERFSTHPIAVSLRNAYSDEADGCDVADVEEVAGQGVRARVNGQLVCVGNSRMMQAAGITVPVCHEKECENGGASATVVHVSIDGVYAGHIVIADTIKDDARRAVSLLRAAGVQRTVMLTGDREEVGAHVARELGLDEYHAALLPAGKVEQVERLLGERTDGRSLAFVGDGINDAPVLARADVGIAMGALGSDAAIEAADVVIMDDQPSKVALAMTIARRTIAIARQNVVFAIAVKVLVLLLAAIGMATMWMAVFADVGVTVLTVLNAMRTLREPS